MKTAVQIAQELETRKPIDNTNVMYDETWEDYMRGGRMTREEAIEELKILKEEYWDDDGYGHETKQYDDTMLALDVAIRALEHPEKNVLAVVPCGDAISRVEVLKLMQDNWHTHNGDWAMQESMDDIRALPSVTPQEPRWIPVGEKLPKSAFGCLVTVDDDRCGEPQRVLYPEFVGYDGETWNNAGGNPIPFEVIAWMPLPKAYSEV